MSCSFKLSRNATRLLVKINQKETFFGDIYVGSFELATSDDLELFEFPVPQFTKIKKIDSNNFNTLGSFNKSTSFEYFFNCNKDFFVF